MTVSYASGFMLGASIGKAVSGMLSGSKQQVKGRGLMGHSVRAVPKQNSKSSRQLSKESLPAFACVSAAPGRRRFRAAALLQNESLARMLQEYIPCVDGVIAVEVNALTGSILVLAEGETVLDYLENFFRIRLFHHTIPPVVEEVAEAREEEQKLQADYTRIIHDTFNLFSHMVYKKSHHMLDLRSLLSLIFTIAGLRKIVMAGQRFNGPQMLWWASSLVGGRR
jgi:hypothetical protein